MSENQKVGILFVKVAHIFKPLEVESSFSEMVDKMKDDKNFIEFQDSMGRLHMYPKKMILSINGN